MATGIVKRHSRRCNSRSGGRCNCTPAFQAAVWSTREQKRIRKHFPTLAGAKAWRADALVALRRGEMRAPTRETIEEAARAWLELAKSGGVLARGGKRYKPASLRGSRPWWRRCAPRA